MNVRALSIPIGLGLGLGLGVLSCDDHPPVVRNCMADAAVQCPNLNDPAGRIEGTLIYEGPAPRLDHGAPAGRVVLLLFEADNPPPPAGTATTAVSFQTIGAEQLFRNATILPNGLVRASIAYTFPGISRAGVFQIRAFYSRGEPVPSVVNNQPVFVESGFHPLFTVRNQPVLGDVGGGAIVDPNAAIPAFVRIPIGVQGPDGNYVLPTEGFVASNISVFVGKVFDTERPMFNVIHEEADLQHPNIFTTSELPAAPGATADAVPPPSEGLVDYARATGLLPPGSPRLDLPRNFVIQHPDTGTDLPSFTVRAGFRDTMTGGEFDECTIAALAGVRCASDPMQIGFLEQIYDRNSNGIIELLPENGFADSHPTLFTTSPLARMAQGHLPWVYPLVILTKLHDPTDQEADILRAGINGQLTATEYNRIRVALNKPEGFDPVNGRYPTLLLGTILPGGNPTDLFLRPWARGFTQTENPARIAIIPIAIEVHGNDPTRDWWGIIPPSTPELIRAVSPFLPQHYRCWDYDADWESSHPDHPEQAGVPVGRYAINVINPNGQVWTVPNELGGFPRPATAVPACTTNLCSAPSQSLVVRITSAVAPPVPVSCPTPAER